MSRREPLSLCLLLALLSGQGRAQRLAGGRGQSSPAPGPLHETILAVFDTDRNGAVSLDEIQSTLDGLAAVAAMGMAGGAAGAAGDSGDAASQLAARVLAAKDFAPMLLKWMDADGDGELSPSELQWATSAHAKMKQSLKELTSGIFDAVDADADDSISPDEIKAAMEPEVLGKVCAWPLALSTSSPAQGPLTRLRTSRSSSKCLDTSRSRLGTGLSPTFDPPWPCPLPRAIAAPWDGKVHGTKTSTGRKRPRDGSVHGTKTSTGRSVHGTKPSTGRKRPRDETVHGTEASTGRKRPRDGSVTHYSRPIAPRRTEPIDVRAPHPPAPFPFAQVVALLQAGFPVPSLSASAALTTEDVASLLALVDSDADGSIGRKEAYRAVSSFKKQFLEAARMLETMGPMLAVFGGGMDLGRGGRSSGRGGRGAGGGPTGTPGIGRVKVARPSHEPPKTEL
jgi:Ca2+-binding EF-hand superfamily protein